MERIPITRADCIDYVIEQLSIGDPLMLAMFEDVAKRSEWIKFRTFADTAEIIYQHALKYDK
jgi:hypothetical protein